MTGGTADVISLEALEQLLDVTRKLSKPFDIISMLQEVTDAGKHVIRPERISLWLHDAKTNEFVLRISEDLDEIRVPADSGIVGECAKTRELINIKDCQSDPRFNPEIDQLSGFHTRCMLSLPLVGHDDALVGVLQLLNDADGEFDDHDEHIASYLAAQCAVALQRAQMIEALVDAEKLAREVDVAREVQMSTLPKTMPDIAGYEFYGRFIPADATGGDTFDIVLLDEDRLFVLMGDATGHGIGPALSSTQMQAMLRLAFRLGADLDTAFREVNNQLTEDLPDDRFVTAFMGLLAPNEHRMYFHSGEQGPILHFHAKGGSCEDFKATSLPLGVMPLDKAGPGRYLALEPGDILVLLSDGIYEFENPEKEQFGDDRVAKLVEQHHALPPAELGGIVLEEVYAFGGSAPQRDDITVVLVKRSEA